MRRTRKGRTAFSLALAHDEGSVALKIFRGIEYQSSSISLSFLGISILQHYYTLKCKGASLGNSIGSRARFSRLYIRSAWTIRGPGVPDPSCTVYFSCSHMHRLASRQTASVCWDVPLHVPLSIHSLYNILFAKFWSHLPRTSSSWSSWKQDALLSWVMTAVEPSLKPSLQPPPGVQPNFVDPDSLLPIYVATMVVCMVFASLATAARLLVKMTNLRSMYWEFICVS